jgi:hypothetical protein
MTNERSLAQIAADKANANRTPNANDNYYSPTTTNPDVPSNRDYITDPSAPYPADRGTATPEQFSGNFDRVQIPDRGVTGDTTTAVYTHAADDTVVTAPDGSETITHADGKVTVTDTKGNPIRSSVPGRQVAIDTAREKAFPTNPRFPGEGNPNFTG